LKKNFSLYIILIPILAVLISITLITIHNIKELNATAKDDIKEFTKNYFIEEKTKIYNKVHFFSNLIKLKTDEFSKEQRNSIKQNVEKIDYFESYFLDNHNKAYSKKLNKAPALKKLFKNNYINIIIDLDSKKILLDEKKVFHNFKVENISDLNGLKVLNKNRKFDEFIEIKLHKNKYLFYIKKLKDSNLLILSGNDSKKLEDEIKKKILNTLLYFDTDNRYYMFIMEIFNKHGGHKYGQVLLHQANPSLVGKFLDEKNENKDIQKYRRDYLKIIRESGEGFITYDYFKPENNTISKKLSFFYLQKEWNWVIGSGFYFNDLESKKEEFRLSIEEKIKESVKTALLVGFLLILFISIALYFITSKINRLINNYATSLSESNENLRKQKDIFETLFNKSSDGIIIYSEEGLIINCNDSI